MEAARPGNAELANMLLSLGGAQATWDCREEVKCFFTDARHSLLEVYRPRQRWEMALEALANLNLSPIPAQQAKIAGKNSRLAWWLHFVNGKLTVEPKEQVLNAKGVWTKGRAIAVKRLQYESAKLDFLTAQDGAACAHIHSTYDSGGWGSFYYDFKPQAALALVGHPLLFWADNPGVRVDLVQGDPELRIERQKNGQLKIALCPQPESEQQKIHVAKESPTRLKVVEFKLEHRKILDIVGTHGLELLLQLDAIKGRVRVEWPEGVKFRIAGQAGLQAFRLRIRKDRDGFGVEGQLQVHEQQVFDMRMLLELLAHSKGRFVRLEDGQFLALTCEFRNRLEELRAIGEQHGTGLRFHLLAALVLADLDSGGAALKADRHWQEHLQRLRAAQEYQRRHPGGGA